MWAQDARKKRDAEDFEKFQAALAEDDGWTEVTAFRWLPTGHQVTAAAPLLPAGCAVASRLSGIGADESSIAHASVLATLFITSTILSSAVI